MVQILFENHEIIGKQLLHTYTYLLDAALVFLNALL